MFSSKRFAIHQTEADVENLKNQISTVSNDIEDIKRRLNKPDCCFDDDENHLVITTLDGKQFHVNELDIEECCPMLKHVSTIYYEREVKHFKVDIESDIMTEIISFISCGRFTENVHFTGPLFKIITMLELDIMRIVGEFLLIRHINILTIFSLLRFAVKYKLAILEEKIITTIAAHYELFKIHLEWIPFSQSLLPVTVKIFEKIKFYQNKIEN